MVPTRIRAGLAIGLVMAPLALLAAACSKPAEQPFLTQFFRAARSRDNATLAMMSAVEFSPRVQGEVSSFDITSVSAEQRTPIDFKPLIEAEAKANTDVEEHRKLRLEFEGNNRPALEEIAKAEKAQGKLTPAQVEMKTQWDKWRADTGVKQKALAAAKAATQNAAGPAEASLTQPGQPKFETGKFTGELVSKDVTVNAQVKTPDGQTAEKKLVITIQRVEGTLDGVQRTGRSIITRIQGA